MNFYLKKYGFHEPFLDSQPNTNLGLIVVIPCFNEPDLISSLKALYNCHKPKGAVEVIVVINSGENATDSVKAQNKHTANQFKNFAESHSSEQFQFLCIEVDDLPKKHAGVGLARKIGMDEAVNRFDILNKEDGIIVCFDADATCSANYLVEIENHFQVNKKSPGCAIHYEHPIEGDEYEQAIYDGIINYELHLRYYNSALRFANLPYAFHTVGSSMAVRSIAYQKQGGMNKRKAGEDFYFIHKIIALGGFTELKTGNVIPSPRISDRVPFGTGKAIGDWIEGGADIYKTYSFECFLLIKKITSIVLGLKQNDLSYYKSDFSNKEWDALSAFLLLNKFEEGLAGIRSNSKTDEAFEKRFYVWFDAFRILKLVHFLRDNGFDNETLFSETNKLLSCLKEPTLSSVKEQLIRLRQIES